MRESSLLRAVGRWLDEQPDIWWVKLRAVPGSRRGLPDIVGTVGEKFFAVELKSDLGRISKAQGREFERIWRTTGTYTIVSRDLDHVRRRIDLLRDAGR